MTHLHIHVHEIDPKCPCPACGGVLPPMLCLPVGVALPVGGVGPRPGEALICPLCAAVLIWRAQDTSVVLAIPTAEEMAEIQKIPHLDNALATVKRHIRRSAMIAQARWN